METKRVLLIRHGETDWNVSGRWQGTIDIELNDLGREQALRVARYLRDRRLGAIFASDLRRAAETAAIIGREHGLDPVLDPRWRELNLGVFQGLTRDEIIARYPREWKDSHNDFMGYRFPNGESRLIMQERSYQALQHALAANGDGDIVVVTHGGTIRILLRRLVGDEIDKPMVHISNTSITTLETDDGEHFRLVGVGQVDHLNADVVHNDQGEANAQ
ncbi:histidine phosphatase family protein [Anaerolineae bacterium CFX9]|nr:histidine phosphatase family protein [Anaerolineae bacterium CFX9]